MNNGFQKIEILYIVLENMDNNFILKAFMTENEHTDELLKGFIE